MKTYTSLIVTGSMGYDVIMDFPSRFQEHLQPDKLHQINVSFVVNRLDRQLGGTGTNIAYSLALLHNKNIKLLSSVGKDGQDLITFVKKNNIDTASILVDKSIYTATGKVITDLDGNQIWGFYYGACEKAKEIKLSDYADTNGLLIISANHPEAFMSFQKQAINMKIDYMYDPGMTLTWNNGTDLLEGVKHCTWLVGNDYEIFRVLKLLGVGLPTVLQMGIKVITTLGAEGVRYQDKEAEFYAPAYANKKVEDPTGAGDAWRAGFMTGIVRKLSIEDSLRLGNAMASFAVETYGTANHHPSEKQVIERAESLKKMAL